MFKVTPTKIAKPVQQLQLIDPRLKLNLSIWHRHFVPPCTQTCLISIQVVISGLNEVGIPKKIVKPCWKKEKVINGVN
jgi:hypothetical protein